MNKERETTEYLPKQYAGDPSLLAAIDRKLAEQERVVVALEGGAGSGKTTLAAWLETIYGCTVFHMDDFFLQPHQRTVERLAEPGGNVDRERFYEEVLRPLIAGETVKYRRFDCRTQTLEPIVETTPAPLTVVEGVFSMHPDLADCYDLSVFLRVDPSCQRARILKRNTPEAAERFFSVWIPLEERYFKALRPEKRCDLILETGSV
jgi:uridine kinase